jgi:hypothetical protein
MPSVLFEPDVVITYLVGYLKTLGLDSLGLRSADIYPDGPPPGRAIAGRPWIVVRQQAGVDRDNDGGRWMSEILVAIEVISGGSGTEVAPVGTVTDAYNMASVRPVLGRIETALNGYETVITPAGAGAGQQYHLRVNSVRPFRFSDNNTGARYNHQGRFWRVYARPLTT